MHRRFAGRDGQRRLQDAIARTTLVNGNGTLAKAMVPKCHIRTIPQGRTLIEEGAPDSDLYIILSGSVDVLVKERKIAKQSEGSYIGEMALIDPTQPRCAKVTASTRVVTAGITEPDFTRIAQAFPEIWRRIAIDIAGRVRERNLLLRHRNHTPRIFIGSATEDLRLARTLRSALPRGIDGRIWTEDVFAPSRHTMEDLELQVAESDFAVVVWNGTDLVRSRGTQMRAPRDNVVFELGLFMGALGRDRSYVLKPKGTKIKLPTDILGITCLEYDPSAISTSMTLACKQVCKVVEQLGTR